MLFFENYSFKNFYTSKQKKNIKIFFVLSLVSMTLEMLGIGLIMPFLSILIEPIYSEKFMNYINNFGFNLITQEDLIIFSIISILCVFFIKTMFLSYVAFQQTKFLINLKTEVSNKLFKIYLLKPFVFHLNNNSSKLIRDLNDSNFILAVTKSILTLITEIILVIGIVSLMIFVEPMGTIISFLFIYLTGYLFYLIVQRKASKWGQDRKRHEGIKLQWLQQGFSSIKDIKIMNKFNYFIESFSKQNKLTNDTQFKQDFTLSLPRHWLELFTVIGFTILLFIIISFNEEVVDVIPILGLFAAAAFRIMPSITRIMNSFQSIKFGFPVAKTYIKEFLDFDKKIEYNDNIKKIQFKDSIELINVSYTYPDTNRKILNNINIKIPFGNSIGIFGDSGVGKSTLLSVFLQLLKPQSGKIILDGEDTANFTRQWQNIMGYVPQNVYLNDDTLMKNIALGVNEDQIDIKKINEVTKRLKLDKFINSLKDGFHTKVGEFGDRISGGQRQRIGIARALYKDPQILILDEYTNALDIETEKEIVKEVNSLKSNKTIITITHKSSSLKFCDKIYKLTEKEGLIKNEK
jgi:ABC-type bacteriocin/lantibiotic exporter with double-glycine peptidase domain